MDEPIARLMIKHVQTPGESHCDYVTRTLTGGMRTDREIAPEEGLTELLLALKGMREIERQLDSREELGNLLASAGTPPTSAVLVDGLGSLSSPLGSGLVAAMLPAIYAREVQASLRQMGCTQPLDARASLPWRVADICSRFGVKNSRMGGDVDSLTNKFATMLLASAKQQPDYFSAHDEVSLTKPVEKLKVLQVHLCLCEAEEGRLNSKLAILVALKGLREIERQLDSHEELGNLLASAGTPPASAVLVDGLGSLSSPLAVELVNMLLPQIRKREEYRAQIQHRNAAARAFYSELLAEIEAARVRGGDATTLAHASLASGEKPLVAESAFEMCTLDCMEDGEPAKGVVPIVFKLWASPEEAAEFGKAYGKEVVAGIKKGDVFDRAGNKVKKLAGIRTIDTTKPGVVYLATRGAPLDAMGKPCPTDFYGEHEAMEAWLCTLPHGKVFARFLHQVRHLDGWWDVKTFTIAKKNDVPINGLQSNDPHDDSHSPSALGRAILGLFTQNAALVWWHRGAWERGAVTRKRARAGAISQGITTGAWLAKEAYQTGKPKGGGKALWETQYKHVGGAYNLQLPMGDLLVKLQLTSFELPDGHHWVDPVTGVRPSVAERLQRCGGAIVETQVDMAAYAAAKAAAQATAMADAMADGAEKNDGKAPMVEAITSPLKRKGKAADTPVTAEVARGQSSAPDVALAHERQRTRRLREN